MKRFNELGFAELIKKGGGHAAMASESQYHANISWAASMLYKLTGEQQYADEAVKAIRYTLQCQRTEPLKDKDKTCGFFYRDLARKSHCTLYPPVPRLCLYGSPCRPLRDTVRSCRV